VSLVALFAAVTAGNDRHHLPSQKALMGTALFPPPNTWLVGYHHIGLKNKTVSTTSSFDEIFCFVILLVVIT